MNRNESKPSAAYKRAYFRSQLAGFLARVDPLNAQQTIEEMSRLNDEQANVYVRGLAVRMGIDEARYADTLDLIDAMHFKVALGVEAATDAVFRQWLDKEGVSG